MQIEEIMLKGYRSIDPTRPIILQSFGHVNVFIGPNNCGKSAVFRFLQTLSLLTAKDACTLHCVLSSEVVDDSWWWAQARSHPIEALLTFSGVPVYELEPTLPGRLDNGTHWKMKIQILPSVKGKCDLVIAPQLWIKGGWRDLISIDNRRRVTHVNQDGEVVSSTASDNCPYDEAALTLVRKWANHTRFFDPVRALDRSSGRRAMIDGSDLLEKLGDAQRDPRRALEFENFRTELVSRLNALIFEPVGMKPIRSLEIKGSAEKHDVDMFLTHDAGGPVVSLQHMGTGIAELVVLLTTLLREKEEHRVYFLEEPETHLHPALVRRFLRDLQGIKESQFFVSTHSNTLLDSLSPMDRVYHFTRKAGGGTEARQCDVLTERHGILDDLGVCGSTLLQANSVIWVEGPSDRIYLTKWLNAAAPELIEGSDYAFSYYGGRVLSHFAFEDQDQLISLIRVSRFSVVIMDRDISPDQDETAVRETKNRLKKEAEADADHRLAILTDGREIENDLGSKILGRALGRVVPAHAEVWKDFKPDGTAPFTRQAAQRALPNSDNNDVERLAQRLRQRKVDIARMAVSDETLPLATPSYIPTLIAFIRKSRTT